MASDARRNSSSEAGPWAKRRPGKQKKRKLHTTYILEYREQPVRKAFFRSAQQLRAFVVIGYVPILHLGRNPGKRVLEKQILLPENTWQEDCRPMRAGFSCAISGEGALHADEPEKPQN
jgi:hypothetical protein